MRIGVVGVGRIGVMHARNLAATPGVDQVVVHDPVPGRAAQVAVELSSATELAAAGSGGPAGGAPQVVAPEVVAHEGDLAALLARVDGVLVATPTPFHADVVHAALDAGVPTLVEKPVTGDLESMRAVIAHQAATGTELLVGFQRRFDPAISELKRRIVTRELGDLFHVRALAFDATPPPTDYIPLSGGIFRDMFVHDLDCVPWLVGSPVVQVFATGSVLVDEAFAAANDVDTAAITLTFANGVIATIAGGRCDGGGYDNRIEAVGSLQALTSGLDARSPITSLEPGGHDPKGNAYAGFVERYDVAYRAEVATFVDVIAGRVPNPSPVADSVTSLVLAQACEESLRTGAPVRIDPSVYAAGSTLEESLA